MKLATLPALVLAASCASAPAIPDKIEPDPETEKMLSEALKTSQLIHDKCIALLQGEGEETFFGVQEDGEKVTTRLGMIKASQNGDTTTQESCGCIYTIDIPTFVHEKRSCTYSYATRDGIKEHLGTDVISHTEKPDGRSFTTLNIRTSQTDRNPYAVESRTTTEISADRSGCRTSTEISPDFDKWTAQPYDPAKLNSCDYFEQQSCLLIRAVKEAFCEQLRQEAQESGVDNRVPPLCTLPTIRPAALPTPQTPR